MKLHLPFLLRRALFRLSLVSAMVVWPAVYAAENQPEVAGDIVLHGIKWTGAVDNTWSTAGNWESGKAPTSTDDVWFTKEAERRDIVMKLEKLTVHDFTVETAARPYTFSTFEFSDAAGELKTQLVVTNNMYLTSTDPNSRAVYTFNTAVDIQGDLYIDGNTKAVFAYPYGKNDNISTFHVGGEIHLGYGVLEFGATGRQAGNKDYSVELTDDRAEIYIADNQSPTFTKIYSKDANAPHSITFSGAARAASVTTLENIKDFSITGGNLSVDEATLSGSVAGSLSVTGGASLTIGTDNLLAEGSGRITVGSGAGAVWEIGTTTQTLRQGNNIIMYNGHIRGGGAFAGEHAVLKVQDSLSIGYIGTVNTIEKTQIQLADQTQLTFTGGRGGRIYLVGQDITGGASSSVLVKGTGTVVFGGVYTDFLGAVSISDGATLELVHADALAHASSVTVSAASLALGADTEGNLPTHLSLSGSLNLQDGATFVFGDLKGNNGVSAADAGIQLSYDAEVQNFSKDGTLNLVFASLENLATYTLISGANASYEGDVEFFNPAVNVIVGGETLANSEYTIGYDSATHSYYLTAEFGCVWAGGSTNVWSVVDAGKNWRGKSNWVDGSSAVFLDTDITPGAVETVTLQGRVNPKEGVFFGNDVTTYILDGSQGQFAAGTNLTMRGLGETWLSGLVNVESLRALKVTLGTLGLRNGTALRYSGTVEVDRDAYLTIAGDSSLKTEDGKASLSSLSQDEEAVYSNFYLGGADKKMVGRGDGGRASNALVQGYSISGGSFSGMGRLQDVTLEAGNVITAGASYTLAGLITINSTLQNNGTVSFDNVVFEVGGLASTRSADGNTISYTLISGGTVTDWEKLAAENFRFGGVSFSGLNVNYAPTFDLTTGGSVTVSLKGITPVLWDAAWDASAGVVIPAFARTYASSNRNATTFAQPTSDYLYSSIINGVDGVDVVVDVTGTSGSGYVLAGGAGSQSRTRNIWIYDEQSGYTTKVGGLYRESSSWFVRTLTGDTHLLIEGGSGETVYGGSYNTRQEGDTWLTLAGGVYTEAYGGSYNAELTGDTHLYVSGATVTDVYGASNGSALTGNAVVNLTSGSVTNAYGTAYNQAGAVSGNVDVYLAMGVLGANGTIDGDAPGFSNTQIVDGTRTLHFITTGGEYDMQGNTLLDFDVYDLADGVTLKVDGSRFNYNRVDTVNSEGKVTAFTITSDNLTIQGKGVVEVYGSTGYRGWIQQIDVQDQATLKWCTDHLAYWGTYQTTCVTVHDGSTLDITGVPDPASSGGHLNIRVQLAGNGVDGKGALYKGLSTAGDSSAMIQLPHIELTHNALVNADDAAYTISYGYGASHLDLTGGHHFDNAASSEAERYDDYNYVLTKIGAGKLAFINTTVAGGTLNVLEGSIQANKEASAQYTDVVLARSSLGMGQLVLLNGSVGSVNEFKIASLSGEGRVTLNQSGALTLYVNHLGYYGEFLDADTTYRNNNGYAYATFSGVISGGADASVSKAGAGVQYLTGSDSVYGGKGLLPNTNYGGTYVATGRLYLLGTSTASLFDRGRSYVEKGVVGQGAIRWSGAEAGKYFGELYLGNGVRIFNDGYSYSQQGDESHTYNMIVGVEASPVGSPCTDYIVKLNGNVPTGSSYVQNADGSWSVVKVVNGETYYQVETHSLKQLTCNGLYGDGTTYKANTEIDRSKTLYVTLADAQVATVEGWGRDGYRMATYSGVLSGEGALIKKGAGMLNIDQQNSYTGGTVVEEGTLNLFGWGQLGENAVQSKGASIMLSYQGDGITYAITGNAYTEEATEIANDMELVGTGDKRWLNDKEVTNNRSAALISNIGQAVTFTLSGALSGEGNLLHCGEGTLVLSGNGSSFSLGSSITKGRVHVRKSAGFGATAAGGDANVEAFAGTKLQFDVTEAGDDTFNILAADQTPAAGAEGKTCAGNNLQGNVIIGSTDESGQVVTQMPASGGKAWLVMEGNGYWAPETQIAANGVLVFRGEGSRNIEEGVSRAVGTDGPGAGVLSGCGVVAVSDVDTTAEEAVTRTVAHFATMQDYSGDIVAEGAQATFEVGEVKNKAYTGGSISISGEEAKVDLKSDTHVTIAKGKTLSFTSTSGKGTYEDKEGAAILIAKSATIEEGGTLTASHSKTDYHYTDLKGVQDAFSLSLPEVLGNDESEAYNHHAYGEAAANYEGHFDGAVAVNQTRVGDAQMTTLELQGGSSYEANAGNISLNGGQLTLDASKQKIRLGLTLEGMEGKKQIVLFSEVGSIDISLMLNNALTEVQAMAVTMGSDEIYAFNAYDLFDISMTEPMAGTPLMVYDAGAGIVYLESVPEPGTVTLGLVGLAALMGRRRRK